MAATDQAIYRRENGAWAAFGLSVDVHDADGECVVAGLRDQIGHPVHVLDIWCHDELDDLCPYLQLLQGPYSVVHSRHLLVASGGNLNRLDQCTLEPVFADEDRSIRDLAVPSIPGATSAAVFAVGDDGLFARGVWQADDSIVWRDLLPGPTWPIFDRIDGDDDFVYVLDNLNHLLIWDGRSWTTETLDFEGDNLRAVGDGHVVVASRQAIACRGPDGRWERWPDVPVQGRLVWADRDRQALFKDDHTIWRLESGNWTPMDSLSATIYRADARSLDDIYILNSDEVLHHGDREGWTAITDPDSVRLINFTVGRLSGDVYVFGRQTNGGTSWGLLEAVVEDGILVDLPGPCTTREYWYWYLDNMTEISPGRLCAAINGVLQMRDADGWHHESSPTLGSRTAWGRTGQGLFVITWGDEIYHRNLDEGTP